MKVRYACDPQRMNGCENETFVVQVGQKIAEFQIPFSGGIQEDQMEVNLGGYHRGMEEILIHMGNAVRGGIRLYGVELIPMQKRNIPNIHSNRKRKRSNRYRR